MDKTNENGNANASPTSHDARNKSRGIGPMGVRGYLVLGAGSTCANKSSNQAAFQRFEAGAASMHTRP